MNQPFSPILGEGRMSTPPSALMTITILELQRLGLRIRIQHPVAWFSHPTNPAIRGLTHHLSIPLARCHSCPQVWHIATGMMGTSILPHNLMLPPEMLSNPL